MLENKGTQAMSNKMDLPLLIASRNRIIRYQLPRLNTHLKKYKRRLKQKCEIENNLGKHETHLKRLNKLLDSEMKNLSFKYSHYPRAARKYNEDIPWKIPPNIYHIDSEPFESKKGKYGAFWSKSPRFPPSHRRANIHVCLKAKKLEESTQRKELIDKTCKKYKYVCLGYAHKYPFTINQSGLYRAKLHVPKFKTYRNYQEKLKNGSKGPTPYDVYKSLLISDKYDALRKSYTEFTVGPGRYETRFQHSCPCPNNRVYHPNLNDLVLSQLHAKWLGLKPIKIDLDKYCCPKWSHVVGNGHCHLFKLPKSNVKKPHAFKTGTVMSLKRVNPDGALKYILGLKSVKAKVDSNLMRKLPSLPFRIKYNIFVKPNMGKTISLKKVAFGSTLSRFPVNGKLRPTISTSFQYLSHVFGKRSILSEHNITKKDFSHIKSNLYKIPARLQATQSIPKRKPFLRFPNLPQSKKLIVDEDIPMQTSEALGFYSKPIDIKEFLKNGVQQLREDIFRS